jgi:hypothetical protein
MYKRNSSIMDVAASNRSMNAIIEDLKASADMCCNISSKMPNTNMRNLNSSQESREEGSYHDRLPSPWLGLSGIILGDLSPVISNL